MLSYFIFLFHLQLAILGVQAFVLIFLFSYVIIFFYTLNISLAWLFFNIKLLRCKQNANKYTSYFYILTWLLLWELDWKLQFVGKKIQRIDSFSFNQNFLDMLCCKKRGYSWNICLMFKIPVKTKVKKPLKTKVLIHKNIKYVY
jgi:hypothetical protein